jgi:hypothetical protein
MSVTEPMPAAPDAAVTNYCSGVEILAPLLKEPF